MIIQTYGFDPALNHGVLLKADWDFTDRTQPKLVEYEVLVSWLQDKGQRVSNRDIYGLCETLLTSITTKGLNVGIDWDENTVYWGQTTKLQAVKLAFIMGYMVKCFRSVDIQPIFITPEHLRNHFGFPAKTSKEVVLAKFFSNLGIKEPLGDVYKDVNDALLLSYLVCLSELDDIDYFPRE